MRKGIELGFFAGRPLIYDGTEPVAIDAQAGKGKFTRFLGVNVISPRTAHLSKLITDPKDGEVAWTTWKTLERQGYRVLFINPGRLYGYPSETFNPNTRVMERADNFLSRGLTGEAAMDAAKFHVPVDPHPGHRWIGQGVRTFVSLYLKQSALHPSFRWPCTLGGVWDFYARDPDEIRSDLFLWAADMERQNDAGMCLLIASMTSSPNQWNAYSSLFVERFQGFQPGSPLREITDRNSFDPA